MTGPLGQGYRDFARSFATSRFFDTPFFNTTIAVPTDTIVYATVNMDSIGFRAFALNNHVRFSINWYADEAATSFLTGDEVVIRQGGSYDQSIVVKGAFMKVTATPAGGANSTITLILYETTRSVIPQAPAVTNILDSRSAVAVGAGATVTTELGRVWCGEVAWFASSSLATWQAVLEAIDELGATTSIDFMNETYPKQPRTNFLPSCTVRTRLINTTAGAGNIGSRMTARPGISGM